MSYQCVRPMKVQTAEGKVELRNPGDPVPEADSWPNPGVWVKRGYIQKTDGKAVPGLNREKLLPMHAATEEDIKRGAGTVVPQPGKPLPGHEQKPELPQDADSKSELMSLKRDDLEALAEEHGIENPSGYPNKGELADAILAANQPDEDPDDGDDEEDLDEDPDADE